jgi:hypothetical protein
MTYLLHCLPGQLKPKALFCGTSRHCSTRGESYSEPRFYTMACTGVGRLSD